jgi:hypothetical protein
MARGAFRGMAGGALTLIVLQGLTMEGPSAKVGGLIDTLNGLVNRALDPKIPAIPDHSKAATSTGADLGQAAAAAVTAIPNLIPATRVPTPAPAVHPLPN